MIGDVRDLERLKWAMREVNVVIHAAALKRIEVGAYAPSEMVRTNVMGTMNVIEAAAYCNVGKVVGISSDKAWQPVSPYGQSKALAEKLLLAASVERRGPKYSVVRYGNVAGSTGSIIPRWRALIASGASSVPVTAPSCTRFFMTVDEAVALIEKAIEGMTGMYTKGGALLIPENLRAFQLVDLATAMGVSMNILGLPRWEKQHEGLKDGVTSDVVRKMTIRELREALENV
jgi:UDP-N-acetylglucosamine 4,6-dehydratase